MGLCNSGFSGQQGKPLMILWSAQLWFSTMAITNILPLSNPLIPEYSSHYKHIASLFTKKQNLLYEASFNFLPPNIRTHLQSQPFFASLITELVIPSTGSLIFILSFLHTMGRHFSASFSFVFYPIPSRVYCNCQHVCLVSLTEM